MELVHIDYLTVEAANNSKILKDVNILLVTHHFTWYAQVYLTPNQKANTVAQNSLGQIFCALWFP